MAFFKFRGRAALGSDGRLAPSGAPDESIDALRRRARHRLAGACVLVLLGVVGFPMLFDTQPRPVAVDIPILIPDRNKALPLNVPGAMALTSAGAAAGRANNSRVITETADGTEISTLPASLAAPTAPVAPVPQSVLKPTPKPAPKPAPKASAPVTAAAAVKERFIVQVGAFDDVEKAREARQKLERAGLKTYVHVARTPDGERIRVRLGPFNERAEADRAASRAKSLSLVASVLTL